MAMLVTSLGYVLSGKQCPYKEILPDFELKTNPVSIKSSLTKCGKSTGLKLFLLWVIGCIKKQIQLV